MSMDLTILELHIFFFQQRLNSLVSQQMDSITVFSLVIIFISGALTSFNPCLLSTLPLTISYMSNEKTSILDYLNFITGIVLSLVMASSLFIMLKHNPFTILNSWLLIRPFILVIIGLSLLNLITLPNIIRPLPLKNSITNYNIIDSFWMGLVLGFTSSSCSGPIFMTLIAWITYSRKLGTGLFFLITYMLGYILPILLSIISIHFFKKNHVLSVQIYRIVPFCGFLVTMTGTFSVFHILLNQLTV